MVFDRHLGKLRPIGHQPPTLTSADLGWSGFRLEQHQVNVIESLDVLWMNHVVSLQLSSPVTIEWKIGSRVVPRRILPGQISIVPSRAVTSARSPDPVEFVLVSLEPSFVAMACGELAARSELDWKSGIEDRFIEGICLALKEEVERGGSSGRLYSESLAVSLAVHLLTKHAKNKTPASGGATGTTPVRLRRALEFIEAHLNQDLALKDIAASTGLSPFHFARLFKQHFGSAPYQFVIKRRVERAQELLIGGNLPLAAVATETGFYDQSHFALHFKRLVGMTPRQFLHQCRHGQKPKS